MAKKRPVLAIPRDIGRTVALDLVEISCPGPVAGLGVARGEIADPAAGCSPPPYQVVGQLGSVPAVVIEIGSRQFRVEVTSLVRAIYEGVIKP
jgi:hypothetical protein